MRRRSLTASAMCALVLALAFAPGRGLAAPESECLATPNRAADDGRHWYFRTDRATNQKCWYLRERDATTTGSVAGSAQAQPEVAPAPAPAAPELEASPSNGRTEKALFRDFLRWYKDRGGTQ